MDIDKILSLDDASLFSLFQEKEKPVVANERYDTLQTLLPEYCKRLKKKGVTCQMLHKKYLCLHSDGYAHSRFCTFIQQYLDSSRPVMRLEHKAGDKMFIDAGDKQSIINRDTGEILPVDIFVAILPYTN